MKSETIRRIELSTPEEALTQLPNLFGKIACAMLKAQGYYCVILDGVKTDVVLVKK